MKYFVSSGNWVVEVELEESDITELNHFEAATRAYELIFDKNKNDIRNKIISMIDMKTGEDAFVDGCANNFLPSPAFNLLAHVVAINDNTNNSKIAKHAYYFLSSTIFANAAQNKNHDLSLELEKEHSKTVSNFKAARKKASLKKEKSKSSKKDSDKNII